jgi:multidrug efflux pump subunit AcrA (membrane-fusion protein)
LIETCINDGGTNPVERPQLGRPRFGPSLVWTASLAIVCALSACSHDAGDKDPLVAVQVIIAEKTTMQHDIVAQAVLFPRRQAAITPRISAPVRAFYVTRGSRVHEGQLLATLENRDLEAAMEENKGTYEQAQAAYETATVATLPEELQKAKLDEQAAKKLLEAQEKVHRSREELFEQGALPRKELDQAGVELVNARNQYDIAHKHLEVLTSIGRQQQMKSAAGELQAAKGRYLASEAQLSYSEIRSPIDGFVTERPLYPGEMAAAGAPLITVMDLSQVIAKAHIPQAEAALLKVGDQATLKVPGLDSAVAGKLTVVSPALDPNSTTVEVWVEAANPEHRLKPGTSVQLTMVAQTVNDAISVPASAVLTAPDGSTSVMLVGADGRAHQAPVETGFHQGDQVLILGGIQAGACVITTGAYGLPDKTRVKVEAPARSGKSAAETGAR